MEVWVKGFQKWREVQKKKLFNSIHYFKIVFHLKENSFTLQLKINKLDYIDLRSEEFISFIKDIVTVEIPTMYRSL